MYTYLVYYSNTVCPTFLNHLHISALGPTPPIVAIPNGWVASTSHRGHLWSVVSVQHCVHSNTRTSYHPSMSLIVGT